MALAGCTAPERWLDQPGLAVLAQGGKMTKTRIIGCALVALGAIVLAANIKADQWNKRTVVTLQDPMQIPGAVLQPGTYVFRLVDSQANRHIVRVLNEDETQVIATIIASPNFRLRPVGDTAFGFWETPAGAPAALRTWFYPGDNFGQEFKYPKAEAAQLAAATGQNVPAVEEQPQQQAQAAPVSAPAPTPAPAPETTAPPEQPRTEVAPPPEQQAPATPAPQPAPETTTPPPAQAPPPASLPATGSDAPLIGLAGLLSIGAAVAFRAARQS
jgi:LPXTG-motif cell wall-anchored protein